MSADEIARLREQVALQAMRATAAERELARWKSRFLLIQGSTIWRATAPVRVAGRLVKRAPVLAQKARRIVTTEGVAGLRELMVGRLRARAARPVRAPAQTSAYDAPLSRKPEALLAPRVLIIADLTLPQCAKYRVWQKQAQLQQIGTACSVVSWKETEEAEAALQTHPLVIFYRVPALPKALPLFAEAKRLGLRTYWEADDLIFDMGHYLANRNLDTLEPRLRREVLAGVELFRAAMLQCEGTIASTASLAARMREAGAGPSIVIENALDAETTETAEALLGRPAHEGVVIAYGSGSKAHDADFAVAAPALAAVLRERPAVRLRVIGDLNLPDVLREFGDRVERLPALPYKQYLAALAQADISLAPLEASAFNDAKSNIKFIEAAILGIPSVCSPRPNFAEVIEEGETGFLADDPAAWEAALLRLVDDAGLRARVGAAARTFVLGRYAPEAVAKAQVAPLVAGLDRRERRGLRVLAANVFFAPITFGGATIVAEEMVRRLQARADTEVFVFTTLEEGAAPYRGRRYEWEGVPVFGIEPPVGDAVGDFDNPDMEAAFADALRAIEPDVVHLHSVQRLGAGVLRACAAAGIPYVVTVHDAWWLCARQFMVMEDGRYCFQTTIDLSICSACTGHVPYLRPRFRLLTEALRGAALIFSPSEAHRQLFLANGFDPARVRVNHNGIRMPARPRRRPAGEKLRFGYVGGDSELKGYHLIRAAFETLRATNYELVLVDNTLKLGFSSVTAAEWQVAGTVRVVPPFTQDGLDDFFDGIDVLLFPSQWKESFGLIVAEALARDVWVIVTEGGGAAEFVVDGENGTLIPLRNDPAPLREAIEALLREPGRIVGHVNRYKGRLHDHAQQAEELRGMLVEAARPPSPQPSPASGRGSSD